MRHIECYIGVSLPRLNCRIVGKACHVFLRKPAFLELFVAHRLVKFIKADWASKSLFKSVRTAESQCNDASFCVDIAHSVIKRVELLQPDR